MPTLERKIKKMLTIDDGPEILAKYLLVLDDEVDRILDLSPAKRTTQDIKTAISAATFLTTMNKAELQVEKTIRSEVAGEYKSLSQVQLQKILNNKS